MQQAAACKSHVGLQDLWLCGLCALLAQPALLTPVLPGSSALLTDSWPAAVTLAACRPTCHFVWVCCMCFSWRCSWCPSGLALGGIGYCVSAVRGCTAAGSQCHWRPHSESGVSPMSRLQCALLPGMQLCSEAALGTMLSACCCAARALEPSDLHLV